MKLCNKCGAPSTEVIFYKSKNNKDGLHGSCSNCVRKYYRNRTARIGKRSRKRDEALSRKEKSCKSCGIVFPLSCFRIVGVTIDKRGSYCKKCESRKNLERKAISRKDKDKEKLRLIALIGGSCSRCGLTPSDEWPLACFDFHHKNDKKFSISQAIKSSKHLNGHIEEEIKKCIVLCSNCHKRHHAINGWRRE